MQTVQKKISALGLVLLLAIPLIFSVIIIMQQQVLQIKSHAKFSTATIETITVSKHNIIWVKKGKEILINGKYFDVKSFTTTGDKILVTGYYDHKEDKLASQIRKLFQLKKESEIPTDIAVVKYLFFPTYTPQVEIAIAADWRIHAADFFTYSEKLSHFTSPVSTPPPQS